MRVIVVGRDGQEAALEGKPGDSVMQLARAAGLPVAGECNGSLNCATCHVVVDAAWFGQLDPASESEEEMLDAVFGLTPTSRLSCQIRLTPQLDGLRVSLPE